MNDSNASLRAGSAAAKRLDFVEMFVGVSELIRLMRITRPPREPSAWSSVSGGSDEGYACEIPPRQSLPALIRFWPTVKLVITIIVNAAVSVLVAALAGCHGTPTLAPGMSIAQVQKELNCHLLHQFTTTPPTTDHTTHTTTHNTAHPATHTTAHPTSPRAAVITCLLPEPRARRTNHYLLFLDGKFSHATMIPPFRSRWNYLDGKPIAQWRSQANALERVEQVLSEEAVAEPFKPAAAEDEITFADDEQGSMAPLFAMMLPLLPLQATTVLIETLADDEQRIYGKIRNNEIQQGRSHIAIGNSEDQVIAALGSPIKTIRTSNRETIELYGKIPRRDQPSVPPFDCLAIRYIDGKVHDLLCNDFIDENWWE